MSTKIKIKVTKDIIIHSSNCGFGPNGDEEDTIATNCAISLAVRDLLPNAWVSPTEILPFSGKFDPTDPFGESIGAKYNISLPAEAREFIELFDGTLPLERLLIEPLDFEIEVPDIVLEKLIPIDDIQKILTNHPFMELV